MGWSNIQTTKNTEMTVRFRFGHGLYSNVNVVSGRIAGKTICRRTMKTNRCRPRTTTTVTRSPTAAAATTTAWTTAAATKSTGGRAAHQKWRWIRHHWPCDPIWRVNYTLRPRHNWSLNRLSIHFVYLYTSSVSFFPRTPRPKTFGFLFFFFPI